MSWPHTVRKSDLLITPFKSSGPGGQHRNKTCTAIRIKHTPTGEVAQSSEFKSQHINKKIAFRRLAEKLIPLMLPQAKPGERPQKTIRTYHEPRNIVRDHRLPKGEHWSYPEVINGKSLEGIIHKLRLAGAADVEPVEEEI